MIINEEIYEYVKYYTILFVSPIKKRVRSKYLKCTRCNVIYFASYTIDVSIYQLSITIIKSAVSLINDRWNNIGRQSGSFLNHTITRTLQSSKLKRYESEYSTLNLDTISQFTIYKKEKEKNKSIGRFSRRIFKFYIIWKIICFI